MPNVTEMGQNLTEFGSWDLSGKLSGSDFSDFQLFMQISATTLSLSCQ